MKPLTDRARRALPDSDFAIPDRRAYPIHDEDHAAIALDDSQAADAEDRAAVRRAVQLRFPHVLQMWDASHALKK